MVTTQMPGEDIVARKGFLPLKETAFLSAQQVNGLVHPKSLNSGKLENIYRNIEADEVPEPEVHEVFFKDADSNSVVREIVFVDPLYSHKRPRMLVSVDAVRATHQGIAIMARKVDKLLATLCACREDFWKDLINLREQIVASKNLPDDDDSNLHLAMWFHPPKYQDMLSMELLEQRVNEIREEWGEMYRQKESELNLLKAHDGKNSGMHGVDPKLMLAKMAKAIPLEHLLVIVRNAAPNHESFYTALERLLAQRKGKRTRETKVIKTESSETEPSQMVDAFLQSDFKRFQKEHDRMLAVMAKMKRRDEELAKKHEDAIAKVHMQLDESKERLREVKEKLDTSTVNVKQLEKELQTEKSMWSQIPTGNKPTSPRRHAKKSMGLLASRLDSLPDDFLRVLAQSVEEPTRLSLAEECVMAMGSKQQESILTTLRCCQAGGSDHGGISMRDDMSHGTLSMSPSHSQLGSSCMLSRSHSQMDKESVCASAVSSPRSHFQEPESKDDGMQLQSWSRSESRGSLANKSTASAQLLEDDDEDDNDVYPSMSERTWRRLLDSCTDHKKHYPDVRRRESMMSQPFSYLGRTSERSSLRSSCPSDTESAAPVPFVDGNRPGYMGSRSRVPSANEDANRFSVATPTGHRESRTHPDNSSIRSVRTPRKSRAPVSKTQRLFLDISVQTDDTSHDTVIRQLRADLTRANEYMPSSAHQKVIKRIVERTKVIKEKIFVDLRTLHECVPVPFFPSLSNVKAKLWSNATQTDTPLLEDAKTAIVSVRASEPAPRVGVQPPKSVPDTAVLGFRQSLRMRLSHLSQAECDESENAPLKDDGSSSDHSEEAPVAVPPPSPCAVLFSPGGPRAPASGLETGATVKRPLLSVANTPGVGLLPHPPPPSPQPDDGVLSEAPSASTTRRSTRSWEPSLPDTKEETAASLSAQEAGLHVASDDSTQTALRRKSSLQIQTSTIKLELPAGRRPSQLLRKSIAEMCDLTTGDNATYSRPSPLYECHNEQEDLPLVPEDQIAESPVDTNSSSYNEFRDHSPGTSVWTSRQTSRVNSPRSMFTSRNTSAFTSRRTSISDSNYASRRVSILGEEIQGAQTLHQRLIDARRPSVVLSIPPLFDSPDSPEGGHVFDVVMMDIDIQTDISVQKASKALFDEDEKEEMEFSVAENAPALAELLQLCMNFLLAADPSALEEFIQSVGYALPQNFEHDTRSTSDGLSTSSDSEITPIWATMDPVQMAKHLMTENSPLLRRRRAIEMSSVPHQQRKKESQRVTRVAFEAVARRTTSKARQTVLEEMAFNPLPKAEGMDTIWAFHPLPPRAAKSTFRRTVAKTVRVESPPRGSEGQPQVETPTNRDTVTSEDLEPRRTMFKSVYAKRSVIAVKPVVVQQTVVTHEGRGFEQQFRHRDTLREMPLDRKKMARPKLQSRVRAQRVATIAKRNMEVTRMESLEVGDGDGSFQVGNGDTHF